MKTSITLYEDYLKNDIYRLEISEWTDNKIKLTIFYSETDSISIKINIHELSKAIRMMSV